MNKADVLANTNEIAQKGPRGIWLNALLVSAVTGEALHNTARAGSPRAGRLLIFSRLRAPSRRRGRRGAARYAAGYQRQKGRLILPQVQTIRDLLDGKALVLSCTTDCMDGALAALKGAAKAHYYRLTGVRRGVYQKAGGEPADLVFRADGAL